MTPIIITLLALSGAPAQPANPALYLVQDHEDCGRECQEHRRAEEERRRREEEEHH